MRTLRSLLIFSCQSGFQASQSHRLQQLKCTTTGVYLPGSLGSCSGLDHLVSLSIGGKFAFVWDIVQRTCSSLTRPLVLFIKDAEHTICDSFEREAAFQEAFGMEASSAHTAGHNAAVLVAGCSLGDTGADIAPQTPYDAVFKCLLAVVLQSHEVCLLGITSVHALYVGRI